MLSVRILGAVGASLDGAEAALGGRGRRAVLARLAMARGHVVPADRLVEDLWDGAPPPRALSTVQAHVSSLRRTLEPGRGPRAPAAVLVHRPPGYALDVGDGLDAARAARLTARAAADVPARARTTLRAVLALWNGRSLGEFADAPWARAEAERLDELRRVTLERLAALDLADGGPCGLTAATDLLVPHVRDHPLREEAARLLARARHRAGRRDEALAGLDALRRRLAEDCGLDPAPATVELEHSLRGPTAPRPEPPAPTPPRPAITPSPLGAPGTVVTEVRILGTLAATVDGVEVRLGARGRRAVLARLAVAGGEAVSGPRLVEDLWDGSPPPRALAAVHTHVSHLRRALEPGRRPRSPSTVLVGDGTGYALRVGDGLDAARVTALAARAGLDGAVPAPPVPRNGDDPGVVIPAVGVAEAVEALRAVLDAWRGPTLGEFADEPWAIAEVARLDRLRRDVVVALAAAELAHGDVDEAALRLVAHLREHPLHEKAVAVLARAHYAAGRPADALAVLAAARTRIADGLGVTMPPELAAMESAVLRHDLDAGVPGPRRGCGGAVRRSPHPG